MNKVRELLAKLKQMASELVERVKALFGFKTKNDEILESILKDVTDALKQSDFKQFDLDDHSECSLCKEATADQKLQKALDFSDKNPSIPKSLKKKKSPKKKLVKKKSPKKKK